MTLKKSCSKSVLWSVFKTQLVQMRLLLVLFGLLILIVPNLATLAEYTNRYWTQTEPEYVMSYLLGSVGICGYAPMVGLALGMSVMNFGHLHKRKNLDYFHALPVRRSTHFFGRALAALAVLMGAAAVIGLGQTLSLGVTLGFQMPEVYGYIWYICTMIVLPAYASYLFTSLMIILTATLWESIFSFLAVSAVHPVVMAFTTAIVERAVPVSRFYLEWENATVFSPVLYGIGAVAMLDADTEWQAVLLTYLLTLLQILVCGALAWYFFKKRKSEQAESGGATKFKLVVRFCTAVCASTLLGLALLYITENYAGYIAGSLLGLAIAWLVLELLYSRTLRRAMKCLVPNLIGYAVFVGINLLVAFGMVGVPRLPDLAQINAVSVDYNQDVWVDPEHVHSEHFSSVGEYVYTDQNARRVEMASFAEADVQAGYDLAKAILKNQEELYFPYLPAEWGGYRESVPSDLPDHCYVHVALYLDGEALQLSYDDFSTRGRMEEMYSLAKTVAASPEYRESNPSLAMMENLSYVMYENYAKYDSRLQYTLENVVDREAFIRELQAAYLEDLYSSRTYEEEYLYDGKYAAETEPIPAENEGHYVLCFDSTDPLRYFDPETAITLRGGIIDNFYPAAGLQCWLTPQYTEEDMEYRDDYTDRGVAEIYLYRGDYPNACAVLDQLRIEETE